ncbi:hypothetical protein GALL_103240 [mine drainage metagenome]|uniref:Uncharacterized protein n=1 Tax=mine drainage metagenome TaxID=410659 RepID=A0A1J5SID4_9ZZZZ
MISRRNREYITIQLLETQRMLELVGTHPVMSVSLKQKEKFLLAQLEKIPVDKKDTKVVLMFNGNPVKGSLGIDASFIGKVTVPFQNMVTAEFAHRVDGKVGKRGQLNKQDESRLFLTALPRGSFGIELSKLESSDLFEDNQLSDSLSHVSKLIESSSKSDEDFAAELDGTTPRIITSLKEFFKAVSDDKAGVTIESGGIRCELNPIEVKSAFDRVSGTTTTENSKTINGVLKGILLESWKFDFIDDASNTITGRIDENLTEDQVSSYITNYFNKTCKAVLKEGKVLFKNGRERISYILSSIEA